MSLEPTTKALAAEVYEFPDGQLPDMDFDLVLYPGTLPADLQRPHPPQTVPGVLGPETDNGGSETKLQQRVKAPEFAAPLAPSPGAIL